MFLSLVEESYDLGGKKPLRSDVMFLYRVVRQKTGAAEDPMSNKMRWKSVSLILVTWSQTGL